MEKYCNKCDETKPIEEFGLRHNSAELRRSHCKVCVRKANRERNANNPDAHKNRLLVLRYRITLEIFRRMLEEQDFKCAICLEEISENAHVDHCHSTGRVRRLLCKSCNSGLGYFKDSIKNLESAISYLRRFGEQEG